MKKDLKITIEESVLKRAKNEIPNLSGFFENCLKYYLGIEQVLYPTNDAQEILDKIKELQLQLFLLNEQGLSEEKLAEEHQEKIDKVWRDLYLKYRDELILSDSLMEEACKILDVDAELLEDMLDCVDDSNQFFNTWEEVKQWYGGK